MKSAFLSYLLIVAITGGAGVTAGYIGKKLLGGVNEIIVGDPEANQADSKELLKRYNENPSLVNSFKPVDLVNIACEKYRQEENCYSYGTGVGETIVSQTIRNYQIKNGNSYFEESISNSSMVHVANRVLQEGDKSTAKKVDLYKGEAKSATTATYPTTPKSYEPDKYKNMMGKTLDRMFIYILSEQTVIADKCKTEKTEDGYKVTLQLDNEFATPLYKFQMKNIAGLDGYPSFNNLTHVYTLDNELNLKKYVVDETYSATMGLTVTVHNSIEYTCFPGEYLKIPELNETLNYTL